MRISYWSSDVCSSDLEPSHRTKAAAVECVFGGCVELVPRPELPLVRVFQELAQKSHAEHGPYRYVRRAYGKPQCRRDQHRHRCRQGDAVGPRRRSEEHTSELQSLMRISYAVFCLKKKIPNN